MGGNGDKYFVDPLFIPSWGQSLFFLIVAFVYVPAMSKIKKCNKKARDSNATYVRVAATFSSKVSID